MNWELFTGSGEPRQDPTRPGEEKWQRIPPLRSWRRRTADSAPDFVMPLDLKDAVNAALHLRRPLLLSGGAGSGKSTLIDVIARELQLDEVLRWHVTSKSTLGDALYSYDALGRLHASQAGDDDTVEKFVRLGPLGTALAAPKIRAVLIDEIDKSDLDLPGDLLNVMEGGEFPIPVLERAQRGRPLEVTGDDGERYTVDADGTVRGREFPVIVFTSNGERAFSPPFLRRCVRFEIKAPDAKELEEIVAAHLKNRAAATERKAIEAFAARLGDDQALAVNQILEFVCLVTGDSPPEGESRRIVEDILLKTLSGI